MNENEDTCTLQPLLHDWPSAALSHLEREPLVVRVIVATVRGSAPREPGACMLVGVRALTGTIGGGNLEQNAIEMARRQLVAGDDVDPIQVRRLILGRDMAQCCGGSVELWLERFGRADQSWLRVAASAAREGCVKLTTRARGRLPERACAAAGADELPGRVQLEPDLDGSPTLRERLDVPATQLWLYGAGHVGRAVVRSLAELPFDVTWIDSRKSLLPDFVPANTRTWHTADPAARASQAPTPTYHLVMTHDHALDFEICRRLLERGEFAWLGLIGSASKAAKFRARLARAGLSGDRIARLVCPIGVGGLTSKWPAAIAASVTVQLLQELEHASERALFQPQRRALNDDCLAGNCDSCRSRQGVDP